MNLGSKLLIEAIEARLRTTPRAPVAADLAPGAPIERLRAYAAHDGEALAVLERLAATPAITTDLKAAALRHLAQLEADYHHASPVRRGPLAKAILAAIRELRVHFPPPAPVKERDQVIEELLALDADAITRIEEHLPDRIELVSIDGEKREDA